MPELPEVERGRCIAQRHLVGKRIARVATKNDDIVYSGVSPRRFAATIRGCLVRGAHRKGKHLWLELDQPPWPCFHFGMTGSFCVYQLVRDRPRFWKVELLMADGVRLAMPNARRLGRIRLLADPPTRPPICDLGFDPLTEMPPPGQLATLLSKRRAPIKALLLDQSVFAGVGNWIADEVLYQAGICPHRRANDLTRSEVGRLRSRLGAIVRKACAVEADKDRFPRTWLFHFRWGKDRHAVTYRNEKIIHERIGGRTTAWVPTVQR